VAVAVAGAGVAQPIRWLVAQAVAVVAGALLLLTLPLPLPLLLLHQLLLLRFQRLALRPRQYQSNSIVYFHHLYQTKHHLQLKDKLIRQEQLFGDICDSYH
jgi:hypothetical protein